MKFELEFKNINGLNKKYPICRIELNGNDVFISKVQDKLTFHGDTQEKNNILRIHFINKEGRDTVLDDNNEIKQDLNFELAKVIIDGIDLQHLIWESKYVSKDLVIDSCLFFGPKGYWELVFDAPVLKWFLRTNHDKNKNDPTWETDYNYYEKVCQKLNKIQTR